ncbi:MAG: hypothetical protein K2N87_08850 [Eubacterium sp.]|nr:hypothetical protein [Eubacterium sp.]
MKSKFHFILPDLSCIALLTRCAAPPAQTGHGTTPGNGTQAESNTTTNSESDAIAAV